MHYVMILCINLLSFIQIGNCIIRDPFVIPDQKKTIAAKKQILLEGIVYAGQKRSAAVLVCGDKREVVERGQRFAGYQLVTIGKDFVVIVRANQKQKLFIQ